MASRRVENEAVKRNRARFPADLREMLVSNEELAEKFAELERKVSTHDQAIVGILKAIRELMNPPVPKS